MFNYRNDFCTETLSTKSVISKADKNGLICHTSLIQRQEWLKILWVIGISQPHICRMNHLYTKSILIERQIWAILINQFFIPFIITQCAQGCAANLLSWQMHHLFRYQYPEYLVPVRSQTRFIAQLIKYNEKLKNCVW